MNDVSTGSSGFSLVQPSPPEISETDAASIARELFGIAASARTLGSHQDRNFLLESEQGRVLLKIANPGTSVEELEAQSRATEHLAAREPTLRVPRTRAGLDGELVQRVAFDGQTLHARVLDFLEGDPLSGGRHLSAKHVDAIGSMAGRVARALADFDEHGVERPHQWDLRRAPAVLEALLPHVGDVALRAHLAETAAAAWVVVDGLSAKLPVQVIHGDLTDDNVVASRGSSGIPDGVIDFGDLNAGWAVGELAITVSSLLHHAGGGIVASMRAVRAYHEVRPLSAAEASALWPLVVVRGAILVASAHHVLATDPGNDYASGNLEHEITIFERASGLPLPVATALVRSATGHEARQVALPEERRLLPDLDPGSVAVLDLSPTSPLLHEGRWLDANAEPELAASAIAAGADATLTRFAEPRLTRSRLRSTEEPENCVLGIELTLAAPHTVAAPWAGMMVPTADGVELRGNGLVLRLAGVTSELADGTTVSAGTPLGIAAGVLRVTAARDDVEVPWIVAPSLAAAWRVAAADPTALILGAPLPEHRTDAAALIERRRATLAEVQEYYYEEPPVIVRGWKEWLVDADGRVYLDVLNNVTSIGHAHPRLVQAVAAQWSLLNTNSRFNYPSIVDFAERLAALLPDGLDSVFLVNSGSEAVDLALRLGRVGSGRREVLAVREAYHGWTDLSDSVSTSIADNPDALATRPDWVHTVDAPNSYRGTHRGAEVGRYAEEAVAVVDGLAASGTPVGTFIAETFYGNAGGIELPDGYLEAVYAVVRRHGGLVVADEVQVGYGRLGDWGFEQQGVVPDIVTIAKAMGNGHPLGAVITTREIADRYRSQGYFFSSAGGSPVSSVVGTTVLDVIRDERLQENAVETGGYLKARLAELGERHRLIGAVHGSGFYLGVEFVRDRETLEPATEETTAICDRLRELGVIVQPTSDRQCVLKIKPPMCLTRASADFFVDALDEVLTTGW
ncbi:aminotransferase [Agromyces albus]|uniref:aminotransferase n=1 Tax=Agromyces albus TaxID=205332 RepID=UPI00277D3A27|nr:aminotransferase [Agromyces albus]MDQ0575926.1 4-aminobutyrate aminotransferase-like enzyme/Ser/Thr protein kinase RdoA (MazF antagonist) [Agromyces albus]